MNISIDFNGTTDSAASQAELRNKVEALAGVDWLPHADAYYARWVDADYGQSVNSTITQGTDVLELDATRDSSIVRKTHINASSSSSSETTIAAMKAIPPASRTLAEKVYIYLWDNAPNMGTVDMDIANNDVRRLYQGHRVTGEPV